MSHIAGDATPAPKLNQRLWDLKIMWLSAEVKQTLFCSARARPGCSLQAKISAKSNKYINHWEHPSLPQGRDRFIIHGWSCAQMLVRLLPALHVQWEDVTSWGAGREQRLFTCTGFLDQAFLILYSKLHPLVNNIIVCLYYVVNCRQVWICVGRSERLESWCCRKQVLCWDCWEFSCWFALVPVCNSSCIF